MHLHFLHKDLPLITKQIDNTELSLNRENVLLKKQLKHITIANNSPKNKHKAQKKKYSNGASKVGPSRRRSSMYVRKTRGLIENLTEIREEEDTTKGQGEPPSEGEEDEEIFFDAYDEDEMELESTTNEEEPQNTETNNTNSHPSQEDPNTPVTTNKPSLDETYDSSPLPYDSSPLPSQEDPNTPITANKPSLETYDSSPLHYDSTPLPSQEDPNTSITTNRPSLETYDSSPLAETQRSRSRRNQQMPKRYQDNLTDSGLSTKPKGKDIKHNSSPETQQPVYCICKTKWQDGVTYIGCDFCDDWFHHGCVGVPTDIQGIEKYRCPQCRNEGITESSTKKKQTPDEKIKNDATIIEITNKLNKSETERKSLKEDLKLEKETCKKLEIDCKTHVLTIEKKQKNLESLSNQQVKMKKELSAQLKKIEASQKKIDQMTAESTEMERKNKELKKENDAFQEFVSSGLESEAMNAELTEKREQIQKLHEVLTEKQKLIGSLQHEVNNLSTPKSNVNAQQISMLKAQVEAMESETLSLKNRNENLQHKLDTAKADYQREKDLITFLVQKQLVKDPSTPTADVTAATNQSSPPPAQLEEQLLDPETTNRNKDQEREAGSRQNKTFCVHEFFEPGSCPFDKCLFSHSITAEERKDRQIYNRLFQKKNNMRPRRNPVNKKENNNNYTWEPRRHDNNNNNKDICEAAYYNGPQSCLNQQCPYEHNLDYKRIRRGTCHFHVLGRCSRKERCRFSHQIPSSVRDNPNTLQWANAFVKPTRNSQPKQNVETSHQHSPSMLTAEQDSVTKNTTPQNNPAPATYAKSLNVNPVSSTQQQPQQQPQQTQQAQQNTCNPVIGQGKKPAPVLYSAANMEPENINVFPNSIPHGGNAWPQPATYTKTLNINPVFSPQLSQPTQAQQSTAQHVLGQGQQLAPAPVLYSAVNTELENVNVPISKPDFT